MDATTLYRDIAAYQHPMIPRDVIDSLPIDPDGDSPWIAQTGGYVMVIERGTRSLGQVDDGTLMVVDTPDPEDDPEGTTIYEGGDFAMAWTVFLA